MRILVVCDPNEKERIRNILYRNNVAALPNILFEDNPELAQRFIDNHLLIRSGHIDLILLTDSIKFDATEMHLVDRLRNNTRPFSKSCFKLCALPVIYYAKEIRQAIEYKFGYDARVEMSMNNNHKDLLTAVQSVVKKFRNKIFEDLELLRINLNALQGGLLYQLDRYYHLKIKNDADHWASRTGVLSRQFIAAPKRLEYDWITMKPLEMERNIGQYGTILKPIIKFNRKQSEKTLFHTLFNSAKWLLQTDIYETPIYEPSLMKGNKWFEEPDYILPSSMPGIIPNSITEVKLPNLELIHRRKRKPGLKMAAHDALGQVAYYRRHVRKKTGMQQVADLVNNYGPVQYTLLASNEREAERNAVLLKELLNDQYRGIKLLTHDGKLAEAIQYYERIIRPS